MKKIISTVLVLILILSLAVPLYLDFGNTDAFAASYDDMLLDFGKPGVASDFGFTEAEVDSTATAKWIFKDKDGSNQFSYFYNEGITTDWRAYTAIKIRYYLPESHNDKMSILLSSGSATSEGYYLSTIELNKTGWQEASIPFSSFSKKNGLNKTSDDYWGDIKGIYLFRGDWINAWSETDTMVYIQNIKLSGRTQATMPKADLVVGDFHSGSDGFSSCMSSGENTRIYHTNAKWTDMESMPRMVKSFESSLDAGGQQYLNAWVYSENANNADIHVVLYSNGIKNKNVSGIEGWYIKSLKIDFTGWKLFSIPIKDFSRKNAPNLTLIKRIELDSRVWNSGDSGPMADTVLCFDKIWFGAKPADEFSSVPQSSILEGSSVNANVGFAEFTYADMLFPYNTMDSSMAKKLADYIKVYEGVDEFDKFTVSTLGNKLKISFTADLTPSAQYKIRVAKGLYNKHGIEALAPFELSFRVKSGGLEDYIILETKTEGDCNIGALVPSAEQTKNYPWSAKWSDTVANGVITLLNDSARDFSDYSYLNFWAYSEKATGSILNVIMFTEGTNKYFNYKRNIDWTGWKLISIDLSKYDKIKNEPDLSKVIKLDFDARVWHTGDAAPSGDTALYFDKIWLSSTGYAPLSISENVTPSSYDDFIPIGGEAQLSFNNPIDVSTLSDGVSCTVAADITADGKSIKIRPTYNLPFNSSFGVSVNKKLRDIYGDSLDKSFDMSFSVGDKALWSTVPVFSDGNIAIATVYNPTDSQREALMLVGSDAVRVTLALGETKPIISAAQSDGARAVVVDSLNGRPLHSSYGSMISTSSQLLSGEGKSRLTVDEYGISGNEFILKLSLSGKGPRTSVAILTDKNGKKLFYVDDIASSGEWRADMRELASGFIDVTVYARCAEGGLNLKTHWADDATKALVLAAVKANAKEGLTDYGDILELKADIGFMADTLNEQKPYSSYDYLKGKIQEYSSLLEKIKSCSWSELATVLDNNSSVILHGSDDWSVYKAYTDDKKNAVCQEIADKSYNSFKEFREVFSAALGNQTSGTGAKDPDSYNSKNDNYPSGGSGGGGGGGGITIGKEGESYIPPEPQLPAVPEIKPESSGDGYFKDLSSVPWALEAIEALTAEGVISRAADKNFRPDDSVTREEYLKMLLVALGFDGEAPECEFTDVARNEWYYNYVALAAKLGISQGRADGSFGIAESITRQDMAVLAVRALNILGVSLEGEASEFSDEASISSYAKESVSLLAAEGIINGIGGGLFDPLGNSTRAQAAKIIYGISGLR